jgi:hypothetical protein
MSETAETSFAADLALSQKGQSESSSATLPPEPSDNLAGVRVVLPATLERADELKGRLIDNSITQTSADGNINPQSVSLREIELWNKAIRKSSSTKDDKFIMLQRWEGTVSKVSKDSFVARLSDLSQENLEEEAEIPIEEIPEADLRLVEPGAVFYWCIGYIDRVGGQRIRASMIRFRRLPRWTQPAIEKVKAEAQRLRQLLVG